MRFGKKLRLLLFVFLGMAIFYLWGEDIGKKLKEAIEITDLVFKKFVIIPFDEILLWGGKLVEKVKEELEGRKLGFAELIVGFPLLIFLGAIFTCYFIIWTFIKYCIIFFFKLSIALISFCIEGFEGSYSMAGKIFSAFILSSISGILFNYLIFPLFCQVAKLICSLTIIDFFDLLRRGEKKKLKQPIFLTLAILMFCWGSWRLIVAPFLNNLDERLQNFKSSASAQWEYHDRYFFERRGK